jgi:hypothetical protein
LKEEKPELKKKPIIYKSRKSTLKSKKKSIFETPPLSEQTNLLYSDESDLEIGEENEKILKAKRGWASPPNKKPPSKSIKYKMFKNAIEKGI